MSKLKQKKSGAAASHPRRAANFTADYLPFLLAQSSAMACAAFADELRDAGLNNLAWRIMATLRDEGVLSIGRLSEIVLARQPRVTQIVNGLARAGLVSRRAAPQDARVTLVEITLRGRSRIGAMLAKAKAREDFAVAALGARDVQRLKGLLRRLLERAED